MRYRFDDSSCLPITSGVLVERNPANRLRGAAGQPGRFVEIQMNAVSPNPRRARGQLHGVLIHCAVGVICFYQGMIRPFLVGGCKFHPTCSEYAIGVSS